MVVLSLYTMILDYIYYYTVYLIQTSSEPVPW